MKDDCWVKKSDRLMAVMKAGLLEDCSVGELADYLGKQMVDQSVERKDVRWAVLKVLSLVDLRVKRLVCLSAGMKE